MKSEKNNARKIPKRINSLETEKQKVNVYPTKKDAINTDEVMVNRDSLTNKQTSEINYKTSLYDIKYQKKIVVTDGASNRYTDIHKNENTISVDNIYGSVPDTTQPDDELTNRQQSDYKHTESTPISVYNGSKKPNDNKSAVAIKNRNI